MIFALVATDAITYASFRSYAIGQLDQELFRSANLVAHNLGFPNLFGNQNSEYQAVPSGTMATELSPTGQQLLAWTDLQHHGRIVPVTPGFARGCGRR